MKRSLKFLLLLTLVVSFNFVANAQNYPPKPTSLQYCNDNANMFLPETEQRVNALCAMLNTNTSIEFVVVTIETFGTSNYRGYAKHIIDDWGVGKKGLNNGLVLVIAKKDRKLAMEAAEGLRPFFSQAQLNANIDLFVKYMKQQNPDGGIIAVLNSVVEDLDGKTWQDRVTEYEARKLQLKVEREAREKREAAAALIARKNDIVSKYHDSHNKFNAANKLKSNQFVDASYASKLIEFNLKLNAFVWTDTISDESKVNALFSEIKVLHDEMQEKIDYELTLIKKAKRKAFLQKAGFVVLISVIVVALFLLFFFLKRRRELIVKLEKKRGDLYVRFIDLTYTLGNKTRYSKAYPKWAQSKIEIIIKQSKELYESLEVKFESLKILIVEKPIQAKLQMEQLSLDQYESLFVEITETIPQEVRMYKEGAKDKTFEVTRLFEEVSVYLLTTERRGFDIAEHRKKFGVIGNTISEYKLKLVEDSVVYRDIYRGSDILMTDLVDIRSEVQALVATQRYVEDSLPKMREYLTSVVSEYDMTKPIYEGLLDYPDSVWKDLFSNFTSVTEKVAKIRTLLSEAEFDNSFAEQDFYDAKNHIENAHGMIQMIDDFLDLVRERKVDLDQAEKRYPSLKAEILDLAARAQRKADHSDVSSSVKEALKDVILHVDPLSYTGKQDWLAIINLLTEFKQRTQELNNKAKYQIAEAERARQAEIARIAAEKRRKKREEEAAARRRRNALSSSSSSSFGSSSSWGSSSFGGW